MKRLATIILSALILFSFAACDFSIGDSNSTETTESESTAPEITVSEKYPGVPAAYDDILDAYIEIANLNRYEGLCKSFDEIADSDYPNVSEDCLHAIKYCVINSINFGANGYHLGYATKDINGDGTDELFLTDRDNNIYSYFTIVNGEILSTFFLTHFFSYENNLPAIDANGNIYTRDAGKGEHWWCEILKLGQNGKLYGTTFGHYDMTGFGDMDVYNFYYSSTPDNPSYILGHPGAVEDYPEQNGSRITDEELNDLVSSFEQTLKDLDSDGCGSHGHVNRNAGFVFYEVITEDLRK